MEIISSEQVLSLVMIFLNTLSETKDIFMGAIVSTTLKGVGSLLSGDWKAIFLLIGGLFLIWRLRSWLVGFIIREIK